LTGQPAGAAFGNPDPYVFRIEMILDSGPAESFNMPASYLTRRLEVAWKYNLKPGRHTVRLKILNPKAGGLIRINDLITYRNQ
jgi:hypothetical protein